MTFFPDLSVCEFGLAHGLKNPLNVGWLSPLRYCPIGSTPREFRVKLFRICCARPFAKSFGFHPCTLGLCKFWPPRLFGTPATLNGEDWTLGSCIIAVQGNEATYVAPDLIYHYVTGHWYRPPRAFIDAVLAAPEGAPSFGRLTSTVAIVVNPEVGEALRTLASRCHVWLAGTPANVATADAYKRDNPSHSLRHVVITFRVSPHSTPEEQVLGVLGDVDLIYGDDSYAPWGAVEILGVPPTPALCAALARLGAVAFQETSSGFSCSRVLNGGP